MNDKFAELVEIWTTVGKGAKTGKVESFPEKTLINNSFTFSSWQSGINI